MANIILGNDTITGQPVTMDSKDRCQGMLVLGRTGSGKTTFVEELITQDMQLQYGLTLIEPHGDLIANVLAKVPQQRIDNNDVILLDPLDVDHPFGLNLFECFDNTDPIAVQHTVNQVEQVFTKVFGMSEETPRLSQFVRNITYTMVANPGYTLCEVPELLLDASFRNGLVANTTGSVASFWKAYNALRFQEQIDWSSSTLNRVDALVSNPILRPIVGQAKTTINFRDIMDNRKILLLKLNAQQEGLTSLVGSMLISQLLLAALSRTDTEQNKRKQHNLYVDEFQRFSTSDMGTLLVEARKFKIASCVSHQVRAQLDEVNRARTIQAGSLVLFSLIGEDAEELSREYDATPANTDTWVVPSDPLYHLTDHPNKYVRQFEQIFVRRLLEAKSLTIKEYRDKEKVEGEFGKKDEMVNVFWDEYPEYEFYPGCGTIEFNPKIVRKVLRLLEHMFYSVMTDKTYNPYKDKSFERWPDFLYVLPLMAYLLNCRETYIHLKDKKLIGTDESLTYMADQAETLPADSRERQGMVSFGLFCNLLMETIDALSNDPIRVRSSTEVTSTTQTFSDRRAEIANALVRMPRGTARIRIPDKGETKEYVISVTVHNANRQELKAKKPQVVAYTRANYCKTRAAVEEEIQQRQNPDIQPTTKRRG